MALNQLAELNDVALIWVRGHSGIKGNVKADQLAKKGSARKPIGPELILGQALCCTKLAIKNWVMKKHNEYWAQIKGCRQARAFLEKCRRTDVTHAILGMPKNDTRILVQILAGHNHLNYHKHKMGLTPNTAYRRCGRDDETSLHVLSQSPALAGIRLQTFGSALLEPEETRSLSASDILGLLRRSGMEG